LNPGIFTHLARKGRNRIENEKAALGTPRAAFDLPLYGECPQMLERCSVNGLLSGVRVTLSNWYFASCLPIPIGLDVDHSDQYRSRMRKAHG